jgi:hypothetical protein
MKCLRIRAHETYSLATGLNAAVLVSSHPSRKTACVFKNSENAGMAREISFKAKSYLFNLHECLRIWALVSERGWG